MKTNRIQQAFEKGKAFIPFLTCGDPDLETTEKLVLEMAEQGADLIELGIPFSDPTAEGPVIQQADLRALESGTTTDKVFALVERLREQTEIPLVFMTYANVVFSYGIERFAKRCEEAGIDGLILPDVPYEEREEFLTPCREHGVSLISMVAPTSKERVAMIAKEAEGFLYLVSSLGVTGTREAAEFSAGLQDIISLVHETTDTPVCIGFGIATPEQAQSMAAIADGVIVGSAIVRQIGEGKQQAVKPVGAYVNAMKQAACQAAAL